MFFSWLAAQSYAIEVAIGVLFMVIMAPVVLAGMAALASSAERLVVELLRVNGMFDFMERDKKTLFRLRPERRLGSKAPTKSEGFL